LVLSADFEGEVIEARAQRAERVLCRVGVVVKADEEAAVRMKEEDARYPHIELLDELEAEDALVPLGARSPVSHCQTQVQRVAPLREVLRDAAAVEPGLRALIAEDHRRRHQSQTELVELLADHHRLRSPLTPESAADVFFALVSSETYQLLVVRRGWTTSEWQDWLVDTIERELFDTASKAQRRSLRADRR
jgi:hypothetical protein